MLGLQDKSGGKLVKFFNENYGTNDNYGEGFPSRWAYTHDKLVALSNTRKLDDFFNLILSKNYIMRDTGLNEVEAVQRRVEVLKRINDYLKKDRFLVVVQNNEYRIVQDDDDLVFIGGGGFAQVYKRKSNGAIIKKLKEIFITDADIRSRFKREYNITKSMADIMGVIDVYEYFEDNCSYTMEEAEQTLQKYVEQYNLSDDNKKTCIRQILYIMDEVHKRDIIHRDISPNNILLFNGMLKIADFGLGKDLNIFTSHQTLYTNSLG